MGVNKVTYGGNTLIDLTADTVTASKLLAGITAHDKAGNPITGTYSPSVKVHNATATTTSTSSITVDGIPFEPAGYVAICGTFDSAERSRTYSTGQVMMMSFANGRVGLKLNGTNTSYTTYPNWSVAKSGDAWKITIDNNGGNIKTGVKYMFRIWGVQ